MPRSAEVVTQDLDRILSTLGGLRAGFKLQRPIVAMKLGEPTAALVDRIVGQVLDVHETLAVVLKDLDDRTRELKANQDKIAAFVGDAVRQLA
jgi:hypothetical protein